MTPRPTHGGRRPGAGRPRKPAAEAVVRVVSVALTAPELAALDHAREGERRSAYIREVLVEYLRGRGWL